MSGNVEAYLWIILGVDWMNLKEFMKTSRSKLWGIRGKMTLNLLEASFGESHLKRLKSDRCALPNRVCHGEVCSRLPPPAACPGLSGQALPQRQPEPQASAGLRLALLSEPQRLIYQNRGAGGPAAASNHQRRPRAGGLAARGAAAGRVWRAKVFWPESDINT